ncbi:carbohydrate kinase [Pseudooceanicola sediminis]|uniref:Carbohydrate kinase n=1 Tax=Pseudooceanicola sediminis TaxID=2211117 RepID=A0A399J0Q2_9RHOB|nr:FGGY-family carbohydrate kinase [Pseudooceanicola sediminis]KAA2315015.1 carbohydrate kinase [Puniceibacterium sp. HSS470]RII38830.1 carbohydrate kinase [Pseudooceanicola sediminis]|tara:strand:- start:8260 stop:9669 length:1410 start_codon:yes stop_codon:yes gene_type:complete
MTSPLHIAVIDVGKTNAKLALVDAETLSEIAVVTRPNTVLPGPPYPHFDLDGHWAFFLDHLTRFHAAHGIDAISVTTHGASIVLLDENGGLATPMLDYEHPGPEEQAAAYDALRPGFAQTGSPRLAAGLNVGAQLHWLFSRDPGLLARTAHIVTYPQYWGARLTGAFATDVTSLGCHTDLWIPAAGAFSPLVDRLGIRDKIAPALHSGDTLGTVSADVAALTGLREQTPVTCGIHDSNASLYPHVAARRGAFSVVSTGTWVVVMAVGGDAVTLYPGRDTLVNVNALGQPVPSARFMGGREYELIRTDEAPPATTQDRNAALSGPLLLPSVEASCGPYPGLPMRWLGAQEPWGAVRGLALSWYLALMTDTCLGLVGARGPVIVEGPFARNPDYLAMLAALRPGGVEVVSSATGTAAGAALLAGAVASPPATRVHPRPTEHAALVAYAERWQAAVSLHAETNGKPALFSHT